MKLNLIILLLFQLKFRENMPCKGNEIKKLNTYLEQIRSKLVECHQELQLKNQTITAEAIKNKFLGIEEKEYSLMNLFDYHNEEMKSILEWGTMKNYYTTKTYFQLYIKEVLHISDIYLSEALLSGGTS